MADLGSLYQQLAYWNGEVARLNEELKRLKKRKRDVEKVKRSLGSVARNNADDVNDKLRDVARKLEDAIDYPQKEGQLDGIFHGRNEGEVGSDRMLSAADSDLQREINDVDGKIRKAESDRAAAKGRVQSIKEAIAAEQRRQRQAALSKLLH